MGDICQEPVCHASRRAKTPPRSGSRNGFRWLSGESWHTALEIFSKFRYSPPSGFRVLLCTRDIFMRCLARSRSSRPSGCLRQATRPAPAGTCSALRVSLCTAEDCHGYNKFSPCLRASVRAPSPFLPFAGIFRPSPASCKKPPLQGAWASRPQSPLSVGGTPTLLEPRATHPALEIFSKFRYALSKFRYFPISDIRFCEGTSLPSWGYSPPLGSAEPIRKTPPNSTVTAAHGAIPAFCRRWASF
jgi:hypothetical protein